jgi:hypothetical protein
LRSSFQSQVHNRRKSCTHVQRIDVGPNSARLHLSGHIRQNCGVGPQEHAPSHRDTQCASRTNIRSRQSNGLAFRIDVVSGRRNRTTGLGNALLIIALRSKQPLVIVAFDRKVSGWERTGRHHQIQDGGKGETAHCRKVRLQWNLSWARQHAVP